jgi:hypothetical protein
MRLLLSLILLAGSPAFAADQFDLACNGTKWTKRGGTGESYKVRAHIDLAAKKWCEDDCKTVQKIVSANDGEIILTDDTTFNAKTDIMREVKFDREVLMFKHSYIQNKPTPQYMGIQATCKIEAFTAFPGTAPTTVATASTGD